jgi:RHS repeat-associated protein
MRGNPHVPFWREAEAGDSLRPPINQLTQAVEKDTGGTTTNSYAYAYDPVGNITSKTVNGSATAMTYNSADQLTAAGSTTFSYNGNGNLLSSNAGASLSYNPANQTTSIKPAGGSAVSMAYTGEGQTERTTSGSSSFQYDETGIGATTAAGSISYFTNGPDGGLISERLPGGTYYYLYDGLGSVVALTDSSGNIVNQYKYDPYGNAITATEQVSNPFRFTGAIWDSSTGLYKMGERYYDPSVARFTQPDPLGGQDYQYAGGNPTNSVDPEGFRFHPPIPPYSGKPRWHSGNLEWHWRKHRHEWGKHGIGREVYARRAIQLLQQRSGGHIRVLVFPWGEKSAYNEQTSEFAVMTNRGWIKTFFRPKRGVLYWRDQWLKYLMAWGVFLDARR